MHGLAGMLAVFCNTNLCPQRARTPSLFLLDNKGEGFHFTSSFSCSLLYIPCSICSHILLPIFSFIFVSSQIPVLQQQGWPITHSMPFCFSNLSISVAKKFWVLSSWLWWRGGVCGNNSSLHCYTVEHASPLTVSQDQVPSVLFLSSL